MAAPNLKKQLGLLKQSITMVLTILMGLVLSAPVHAKNSTSNEVIDITFKNGSYCGHFSGDLYNGRMFSLWLNKNQELIVRNVGNDQLSIAYVVGTNGRLVAERYQKVSSFLTQAKGKHVVKIYATSPNSSVEFCAS